MPEAVSNTTIRSRFKPSTHRDRQEQKFFV